MSRVLLKKSSVVNKVPVTSTVDAVNGLEYGELAINYADEKLYFRNSANAIKSFSASSGTVTSVAALTLGTTGTDVTSTVANGTTTPVITLNIPTASATNRGALSAADWTTFNNKQPAGTYATGTGTASGTNTGDNAVNSLYSGLVSNATHTGDVTGSTVLTLATVNSNVGTWNNVTVNGKGLVTAGSNTAYLTSESDTLATVTGRGASTSTPITLTGNLSINSASLFVGRPVSDTSSIVTTNTALTVSSLGVDQTSAQTNVMRLSRDGTSGVVYAGAADFDIYRHTTSGVSPNVGLVIRLSTTTTSDYYNALTLESNGTIKTGTNNIFHDGYHPNADVLTTARTIALTGDVSYTSGAFDGSSNITGVATLATVNSNVGTFNNVTVNGKGLVTSASNTAYLTAEADTLATVTGRGASTTTAITVGNTSGTSISITSASAAGTTAAPKNLSLLFLGYNNKEMAKISSWDESGSTGNGNLLFWTGGAGAALATERMRLDSSGNLGLGVTPSAWGSGYKAIQGYVGAFALSADGSSNNQMRLSSNAYNNGTNWIYYASSNATSYEQRVGEHRWYNAPSGTAGNAITFTQAMTLDASGNLIVGNTATANGKFMVYDANASVRATSSTGPSIRMYAGGVAILETSTNDDLIVRTNSVEVARFTTGGNVGIGTTSPSVKLDVKDAVTNGYTPSLRITRTSATLNDQFLAFYNGLAVDGQIGRLKNSDDLLFGFNSGTGFGEKMRLMTTGNVGINTTTPSEKLEVVGNIKHTGLVMTAGTNVDQIYTASDVLTLTTAWQDTSVNSAELTTGSYMVQVYADDSAVGGGQYMTYYTGIMSWYSGDTNEASSDEIVLHRAGHASTTGNIFLRVLRTFTADLNNMKLQIAGITANTGTSTYTYKFRRLI